MEQFERANLKKLQTAIGDIELTDDELKTLKWLSGWNDSAINSIISIIAKARESGRASAAD